MHGRQLNSRDELSFGLHVVANVAAVITEERTGQVALGREIGTIFTSPSKEESKIQAE
jgi:hypothetical protein